MLRSLLWLAVLSGYAGLLLLSTTSSSEACKTKSADRSAARVDAETEEEATTVAKVKKCVPTGKH